MIEGVEKPGNIGAIARTADAAGLSAMVVADGRTDLYNPNAIRASMGTLFVPVAAASTAGTIDWLRSRGLTISRAGRWRCALHRGRLLSSVGLLGIGERIPGAHRCVVGRRHRWHPPADARRGRQP